MITESNRLGNRHLQCILRDFPKLVTLTLVNGDPANLPERLADGSGFRQGQDCQNRFKLNYASRSSTLVEVILPLQFIDYPGYADSEGPYLKRYVIRQSYGFQTGNLTEVSRHIIKIRPNVFSNHAYIPKHG